MTLTKADVATTLDPLMSEYVALCNRAIAENADRLLFRQAERVSRALWGEAHFRTLVYEDHPRQVLTEYLLHFDADAGRLHLLPRGTEAEEVAFTWKTPVSYVRDVVENRPDWYLAHPMQLDWQWMRQRAGDELRERPRWATFGIAGGALVGVALLTWLLHARSRSTRPADQRSLEQLMAELRGLDLHDLERRLRPRRRLRAPRLR